MVLCQTLPKEGNCADVTLVLYPSKIKANYWHMVTHSCCLKFIRSTKIIWLFLLVCFLEKAQNLSIISVVWHKRDEKVHSTFEEEVIFFHVFFWFVSRRGPIEKSSSKFQDCQWFVVEIFHGIPVSVISFASETDSTLQIFWLYSVQLLAVLRFRL